MIVPWVSAVMPKGAGFLGCHAPWFLPPDRPGGSLAVPWAGRQMFRLRTDVPGANPTHAAFQVQPPTPTMPMGMTPMVGMPMGMIQPEPVQAPPLRPLKFIGMSGDGQPVS